jgi:hypothetical protein
VFVLFSIGALTLEFCAFVATGTIHGDITHAAAVGRGYVSSQLEFVTREVERSHQRRRSHYVSRHHHGVVLSCKFFYAIVLLFVAPNDKFAPAW